MERVYSQLLFTVCLLIGLLAGGCNTPPVAPPGEKVPAWTIYTTSNSLLTNNMINAITIDRAGSIWLATDDGVTKIAGRNLETFTDPLEYTGPSGSSRKVSAISASGDGSIWFGLAGGGVRRFNPLSSIATWTSYTVPSLRSNIALAIAVDVSLNVWVGTTSGVSRFLPSTVTPAEGRWLSYTSTNSTIPDEAIHCIVVDLYDQSIWFGTTSQGVATYDGDLNWDITTPADAPLPFLCLSFTPQNTGWFGTYADWAYQYSVKTSLWTQYGDSAHGGRLPDRFVNAVTASKGVWFGTNKGLARLDGSQWIIYDTTNSPIPSDTVKALAFDANGDLWIGTARGVAVFDVGQTSAN